MAIKKIESLDSVRGLAAFIVVLWHFASAFYPAIAGGPAGVEHSKFDVAIYHSPLSIFFAGNFAVVLFFVLSGFVLTVRFYAHQQQSLFPAAVKRYLRLMPIVLASVLISYELMALGLMYFHQAGAVSGSVWLSSTYFLFNPDLLTALGQGLIVAFVMPLNTLNSYNPLLWTIYYELVGSALVFGLASLVRGQPKRWLFYVIAIIGFMNTYFCGFIVGALLADLYNSRADIYDKIQSMSAVYKWALLLFALCIAAYPVAGDQSTYGKYWNSLTLFKGDINISRAIVQLVAAAIIIFLALGWGKMARLLEIKPLLWLGKVSYALYATHLIFIFSLTSWLVVSLHHHLNYNIAALLALLLSLPVMFSVSYLLHKYVELPSIGLANRLGTWAKK